MSFTTGCSLGLRDHINDIRKNEDIFDIERESSFDLDPSTSMGFDKLMSSSEKFDDDS